MQLTVLYVSGGLFGIGVIAIVYVLLRKQQYDTEEKKEYKKIRNSLSIREKVREKKEQSLNIPRLIGRCVGFATALYVFNEVLKTVSIDLDTISNTQTIVALGFTEKLLPIVAILGVFQIVYETVNETKLLKKSHAKKMYEITGKKEYLYMIKKLEKRK